MTGFSYPYALVNWFTALFVGALALVMYIGSAERSTRAYARVALVVELWAIGVGAYFWNDAPSWVIFWNQYNHFIVGWISALFYLFTLSFPSNKVPDRRTTTAVCAIELFLGYLYFFTHAAIHDGQFIFLPTVNRYDLFRAVGPFFYVPFATFFGLALWNLVRAMRSADVETKKTIRLVLLGSIIGFTPSIIVQIALPSLGYYGAYWLGAPLTLGWVLSVWYAIIRRRVFNVRLAIAEISVLVMSAILFINIFMPNELASGIASRIGIFVAFGIVGAFFIHNIVKKESQREELARLTDKLQTAHINLESQVRERSAELLEQKTRSEEIVENLPIGLVECTNDFVVIRINLAAERMLGISRGEVLGHPLRPQEMRGKQFEALMKISYQTSEEISIHYPESLDLHVTSAPIPGEQNSTVGFIKIIRDVTEEKRTAKSKSEFISIAAHKLRTPLSALRWALGAMLAGDRGPITDTERKQLAHAERTIAAMITLVNDLLNVARIDDGRFEHRFEQNDIGRIIKTNVNDIRIMASQKSITVTQKRPKAAPPYLYCDAEKISLALRNVLENALEYTLAGGAITIETSVAPPWFAISIADTGIGIAPADIPRLFTKFFRSKKAQEMSADGTGLGLFIVKNIIARHGGTIEVQSNEGRGTKFIIRLPLEREPADGTEETFH